MASRKRPEELVVEVIAVRQHYEGRVLHRRVLDDLSGVEGHRQALAAPLGVPDDAHAPVPGLGRGPDRAGHRLFNGVELVIGRELLGDARAVGLEDYEVAYEIEETGPLEDALDKDLEGGHGCWGHVVAVDRLPGHEPLPVRGDRPNTGLLNIRNPEDFVEDEEARDLVLVGLQLLKGALDRGVLVSEVLQ